MVLISISKDTGLPLTASELEELVYEYNHGMADIMSPEEFMEKRLDFKEQKIGAV